MVACSSHITVVLLVQFFHSELELGLDGVIVEEAEHRLALGIAQLVDPHGIERTHIERLAAGRGVDADDRMDRVLSIV